MNDPTNVAVRDRVLHDLYLSALDKGVSYWSWIVDRRADDNQHLFRAVIGDFDGRFHVINRTTMLHGLLAAGHTWRERILWTVEYPPGLLDADQDWSFNPLDADVVTQLGIFGHLVYAPGPEHLPLLRLARDLTNSSPV